MPRQGERERTQDAREVEGMGEGRKVARGSKEIGDRFEEGDVNGQREGYDGRGQEWSVREENQYIKEGREGKERKG